MLFCQKAKASWYRLHAGWEQADENDPSRSSCKNGVYIHRDGNVLSVILQCRFRAVANA